MRAALLAWSAVALLLSACAVKSDYLVDASDDVPDPWTVHVEFVGNEGLGLRRLHRLIEDYMLDLSREPGLATLALDAEFDLEDFYRSEGYADVEVAHTIDRDETQRVVNVTFTIREGPLVTARLELVGSDSFETERLLEFWNRRTTGTFGLSDPLFVESEIPAFASTLRTFYRAQGFLAVEIPPPVIERQPGDPVADIRVTIFEGQPFRFGEISIAPALAEAAGEEVAASLQLRRGEIASELAVEEIRSTLVSRLRRIGFPGPVVKVARAADDDDRTLAVVVSGEPGRRGKIEAIEIRGNERTFSWHISSYFEFEIGQWYDGRAIDDTRRELYLSGLFRTVDINHEWLEGEGIKLVVTVEETDTRSIDLLGGYGSYERFRGMVRFNEDNVFGTGRRFSVEGRASTKGYRGITSITDPRFLSTRTSLTISGETFEREEPSFTDRARGVTAALARDLGHGWRVRTGYSYQRRNVADPIARADIPESFIQGNVFAEAELDQRDSLLYPTTGFLATLRGDADDPAFGSEIQFQRIRFTASAYIPIWREINLALRASTGALWPGGSLPTVPIQERFFNGGENTVRSFRQSQLGPKDASGQPIGGEFRNVFSVELRTPVIGILDGAVFADAGNVGVSIEDYGFDDMRYGVGGGLRLKLPIGPVRFDAAWNPDRRDDDELWVFHLSVGFPF